jgi:hypothetical protein
VEGGDWKEGDRRSGAVATLTTDATTDDSARVSCASVVGRGGGTHVHF